MQSKTLGTGIHSPFRYPGGKFYARALILGHIPSHTVYIEPFAGGGSIFFAKNKVATNHLNDKDKDLIEVFKVIRDRPEQLIRLLHHFAESEIPAELTKNVKIGEILPATKELHTFFKNSYKPSTVFERVLRWFYLNRTSYSGIMNVQNMYWGYGDKFSMQPKNWPANIRRTSEKLTGVELTCLDFEIVIDNAPAGALLFIDPPYFNADQDKFYACPFLKADHYRLAECLKRNSERLNLFVTYDDTPEVLALYDWIKETHNKEWNYCIQRTDDQKNGSSRKGERYKGKELFLLNYSTNDIERIPNQERLVLV